LAPEREPSSSSQNSSEHHGLLYILLSAFAFFSGWSSAKLSAPNQDVSKTIPPQDTPTPESRQREINSSIVSQITPTPSQQNQSNGRKEDTPLWEKVAAITIAAGTVGLLIVNIFLWCSTQKAADAAKDSVDLARKTAHFDQRAWLKFSFGTYKYTLNKPLDTAYQVTDTGKTPARNVKGMVVTNFMKNGETPIFNYEHGTAVDFGTMHSGIPQGATSYLISFNTPKGVHVEPAKVTEQMFRELQSGIGYILVYGKLDYDSVFGAHHWIKFCQSGGPTAFTHPKECVDYNDVDNNEEP
jgi:hypothetical protein